MAKKKGVIGRLERPRERQYTLRRLLMAYYWRNPQFMADLSAVMEKWRDSLTQEIAEWKRQADDWTPWERHQEPDKPILGPPAYQEELAALADRWGLRCPWALPWLHYCLVMHLMVDAPDSRLCPIMPNLDIIPANLERTRNKKTIRIEVEYHPWPHILFDGPPRLAPQKAIDEAIRQVKQQIDEIHNEYVRQGYVRRDTEPALADHVYWLYLRICPQPDIGRPWGYEKIGNALTVSKFTVRDNVLALAREMENSLPKLLPGRTPTL